jgi:hypothetical protein
MNDILNKPQYNIRFNKDIYEKLSPELSTVRYPKGYVLTIDEISFNELLRGDTIKRYTTEGIVEWNKYDVEPEVKTWKMIIEYGETKIA